MTSPYRKSTETAARLPEPLPANALPATVVSMPSTAAANAADKTGDRQAQRQQAQQQPQQPLEKTGDMLKRERERLGGDLQQIADYLRIRRAFLEALEHSRYEEFVADAYVIGFLRSYAEHLGLNAKQVVEQYRRERAGRRKQLTLSMPVPVSEGRAPSAIILVGAAAAALVIYIGWYAFSTADRTAVILPPAPPAVTTSGDATPAQPVPGTALPPTADAVTGGAVSVPVVTPGATNAPPVASTPAATAADIVLPVAASAALPATDPTFGAGAKTAPTTARTEQARGELAREEAKASAAEGAAAPAPTVLPATPASAGAATLPAAAPATAPRNETAALNAAEAAKLAGKAAVPVAVAEGPAPRLTITAEEASWVLINDRNGKTVFDKIMQPNETYQVPDQAGLKLTTGNGSQIRLTLNGKALPPLTSNTSQILRNIPLDANGLKNLPAAGAGATE